MARRMKYIRFSLMLFPFVDEYIHETKNDPKDISLYEFQKWLSQKTYYKKKK